MSNLQLRLMSAAILIPLVFGAIILGGNFFVGLIIIAFALSFIEWSKLAQSTDKKVFYFIFGFLYLLVCFYEFHYLRTHFESGLYLVLTLLLVTWAADTGAYLVGKKFGQHKLAPHISPNKSIEGLAGAIVFSAVALLVLISFAPNLAPLIYNVIGVPSTAKSIGILLAGGALGYIGQIGDLIESHLKRKAGAKDSGSLIPGHGGLLDRVDSILLISPFFLMLTIYVF